MLFLLFEDECRVLLFGDVDVIAGVSGGHDVSGARVEENALVVFSFHPDQTHTIPVAEKTWCQGVVLPDICCSVTKPKKGLTQ